MENMSESNLIEQKIEFDQNCIEHLSETRKWTLFLSITGFSIIGILFLVIMIGLMIMPLKTHNNINPVMSLLPLLLIMVVYFFPIYFLFKFSVFSKKAINNRDAAHLSAALKYQKLFYRFMGIFTIIMVSLNIIIGIFTLIGKTFMH